MENLNIDNCRDIGEIGNYYGGLSTGKVLDKFYWSIENWDGSYWEEIPEYLYVALNSYQDKINKGKE